MDLRKSSTITTDTDCNLVYLSNCVEQEVEKLGGLINAGQQTGGEKMEAALPVKRYYDKKQVWLGKADFSLKKAKLLLSVKEDNE